MLLLGHRGARCYAPENTIAAFDLALEHGCDGFEFDVRKTADGHAVVCHDPQCRRLNVASSRFEALLAVNPALNPLDRVLRDYATRAFLYIELKVPGLAETLVNLLHMHSPQKGYVVASFSVDTLREVHARAPEVPLGLIADTKRDLAHWTELPLGFVMPQDRLVSSDLLEELHDAGKRVFVWTVNTENRMRALADLGVDGIVSDDTALLGRVFRRK